MRHRYAWAGAALLALAGVLAAGAQDAAAPAVFGPWLCLPAQFWNTPGWQPREGDYGYVRVAPHSRTPEIKRALGVVPANSRMIRCSGLEGIEQLLHQLIQIEGFQLAAIGYDSAGKPVEACERGQALAHRYGLKFSVSVPQENAEQAGEKIARWADLLSIDFRGTQPDAAAIARQRQLYQRIQSANPGVALFHDVAAGAKTPGERPGRILRDYRGNADLLQGILVGERVGAAEAGRLLRAIRPQLGLARAVAPGEGPAMYFWNFLWNTPGWQPRAGDYAYVKIRPALKTLEQRVTFVMAELKDVPPERRKIMVNGLEGASDLLHELIDVRHFSIAGLDYDLEQWELTPQEEKADPIAASKRGQALADQYHMAYVVVPDMPMSSEWGPKIAPFVAGIAPQCKGLQAKNIDEAIVRQRKLYCEIRRANPDILLYHDLGASPKGALQTVPGLLHYFSGVADLVDGIEIWSQDAPGQNAVIAKYIIAVRPPWQGAAQDGPRN